MRYSRVVTLTDDCQSPWDSITSVANAKLHLHLHIPNGAYHHNYDIPSQAYRTHDLRKHLLSLNNARMASVDSLPEGYLKLPIATCMHFDFR